MCLLITAFAALVALSFWYFKDRGNVRKSGTLALIYLGASFMWLIDCVFAKFEGEAFLDLSKDNALLGFLVVLCGLGGYFLYIIALKIKPAKV